MTNHPPTADTDNPPDRTDRLSRVVATEGGRFRTDSLVGSFFHGDAKHQWQGCVVAEVGPGVFLVETFDWLIGGSYEQRLVPWTISATWHFYDDAEWMRNSVDSVRAQWKEERSEGGTR